MELTSFQTVALQVQNLQRCLEIGIALFQKIYFRSSIGKKFLVEFKQMFLEFCKRMHYILKANAAFP